MSFRVTRRNRHRERAAAGFPLVEGGKCRDGELDKAPALSGLSAANGLRLHEVPWYP